MYLDSELRRSAANQRLGLSRDSGHRWTGNRRETQDTREYSSRDLSIICYSGCWAVPDIRKTWRNEKEGSKWRQPLQHVLKLVHTSTHASQELGCGTLKCPSLGSAPSRGRCPPSWRCSGPESGLVKRALGFRAYNWGPALRSRCFSLGVGLKGLTSMQAAKSLALNIVPYSKRLPGFKRMCCLILCNRPHEKAQINS